jgi:hypothetical protein
LSSAATPGTSNINNNSYRNAARPNDAISMIRGLSKAMKGQSDLIAKNVMMNYLTVVEGKIMNAAEYKVILEKVFGKNYVNEKVMPLIDAFGGSK